MLASERLIYIINRLDEHPAVSIRQLSKELGVSEATVRRDLDELERQGRLKRQHGGAVLNSVVHTLTQISDYPMNLRSTINCDKKKLVCDMASVLVEDDMCIYVDGGSTTAFIIPHLMKKRVHIVTPNMMAIKKMKPFAGTVHMIGGTYDIYHETVVGSLATSEAGNFRYDLAFIGASGLDPVTKECYSASLEVAAQKQAVMKHSITNILLVDSGKFEKRGFCLFAMTDEFDIVYTDEIPEECNIENLAGVEKNHEKA
ncbi:MAG: DeoR/GlpR family DNA-binding transcription regulator [Erysipelotrichaceae bacterium]|nr:DeoR/GlpR family DNA-binding transcription regulator [Erysipelotrichaceae bacterium]MDP3305931.1 DeoR/GlpR family DNA-binding transcription regulator [Erysipelotrichaceae bacterium]